MMAAWTEMRVPKAEIRAKIDAFAKDYRGRKYMQEYQEDALRSLQRLPELDSKIDRGNSAMPNKAVPVDVTTPPDKSRRLLLWGNLVAVGVVVSFLVLRKWLRTRKNV
jgi:hypothetical protein